MREIGKNIAILHDADILHGDLTTSNILLKFDNLQNNLNKEDIE
jgi:tRNA A-37 threonylcarbamoyl transferase component Bud32